MIVLMPVATPTSSRGTDSTTRLAIDAKREADADAEQRAAERDLPHSVVESA